MRPSMFLPSMLLLGGCFPFSDDGQSPANAEQIGRALADCRVEMRDFARDHDLGGAYLVIFHRSERDLDRKRSCVDQALARQAAYVTSVYPEDINRNSLF